MAFQIAIVLGTRPEIIKLAPVIRACESHDVDYNVIHTGQHYSEELNSVFFEQLELPKPDYNIGAGSGSHGEQTAVMLAGVEDILLETEPNMVLVQGDTNSVLAGAIATSKLDIELGHVEAGLRSFDREMPEEINRILTDHTADYLFTPTTESAKLLEKEGIPEERIYITGNTVVDAVQQHQAYTAEKSTVLADRTLELGEYILATAHRPENVDNPDRFASILDGMARVAEQFKSDVIYPIHPRAQDRLEEFELEVPEFVRLIEPQDYLDFLCLESNAQLILTDSGGVQEEACILGVPCVTLRDNTERPETIDVGANTLTDITSDDIVESATEMAQSTCDWTNPFGDGTAGEQILAVVQELGSKTELEKTSQ